MIYCPECGTSNEEVAVFCQNCGLNLQKVSDRGEAPSDPATSKNSNTDLDNSSFQITETVTQPTNITCTQCGTSNPGNSKVCSQCGGPLKQAQPVEISQEEQQETGITCPNCGNQVAKGIKFCGECGHQLSQNVEQVQEKKPVATPHASPVYTPPTVNQKYQTGTGQNYNTQPGQTTKPKKRKDPWIPVLGSVIIPGYAFMVTDREGLGMAIFAVLFYLIFIVSGDISIIGWGIWLAQLYFGKTQVDKYNQEIEESQNTNDN